MGGAVGAVTLGPVGALAGALLGGKGKDVTFILTHEDGRKMLATNTSKQYTKLQAILFAFETIPERYRLVSCA
ncbi:hypothetical protein ACQPW1_19600 [Nocardia sp. CA-128927]|uniref:hypothetical protein n=1 Tax=Nocardia sp. CA-128927 TaxID=3239975 RepID=UPI003D99ECB1